MRDKKNRASQAINHLIYKGVAGSQKEVGEMLGYGESYFSQIVSGSKALSNGVLEKLAGLDKELNLSWLLTGEGSMLVGDNEVEKGEHREEDMVLYYPDIPATASGVEDMPEPSWDDLQPQALYIPQFGGCRALKAWGDSMYPKINSGDIVVFSEWLENYVQNGEIYLVITRNGERMFKYLSELPSHEGEERQFECLSANPDQRRYSPFKILASDIVKLYRVRGRIQEI